MPKRTHARSESLQDGIRFLVNPQSLSANDVPARNACPVAAPRGKAPPAWLPDAVRLRREGVPATEIIRRLRLRMGPTGLTKHLLAAGARVVGRPWQERFSEKVDRTGGPDACWLWTASCRLNGYGQFARRHGRVESAHRVAWELANDTAIPDGMMVRHRCDNPPCCNPAHLELGTGLENARDMIVRGRSPRGIRRPNAKLSDAAVVEARRLIAAGLTDSAVARRLRVSSSAIHQLRTGKTWTHVEAA